MFAIPCDACGTNLLLDQQSTIDMYMNDADYVIGEDGKLVNESIQEYIVYKCPMCDSIYKFTYKEWEVRYRRVLAERVMELRKQKMFREEINPQTINPDNGLEFCGQCSGYAGDGNCLVDIIKQCTIRKK